MIGIVALFLISNGENNASYVAVTVKGEQINIYELSSDRDVYIETENGGENCLRIENGKAFMLTANCPNGDCLKHKEIFQNNESIICLPHSLTITVQSHNTEDALDAVAH